MSEEHVHVTLTLSVCHYFLYWNM